MENKSNLQVSKYSRSHLVMYVNKKVTMKEEKP